MTDDNKFRLNRIACPRLEIKDFFGLTAAAPPLKKPAARAGSHPAR